MSRFAGIVFCGFLAWSAAASAWSAERPAPASMASESSAADLFEAEADNLVTLRYIPNDAKSAQVIVVNRTNRPLTLRLPANFVGVPVLAQMGGMGGMGGGRGGMGGGQATGGGMGGMGGMGGGGMGGMGGGGMGGMGGGAFSIPPEKSRTFRVPTVCLEHGKPEPSPRQQYKLIKTESFSSDPKLALVLASLGRGELSQKVAQAATWHVSSGLTWESLAGEMIDHVGAADEPYFTPAELMAAHRVVSVATEMVARGATPPVAPVSPGELAR